MIIGPAKNHEAWLICKSASFVMLTETATRYDRRSRADMDCIISADPATAGGEDREGRTLRCLRRAALSESVAALVSNAQFDANGVDLRYAPKGMVAMKQCKESGCYKRLDTFEGPVIPDICPSCALKERRRRRGKQSAEVTGHQWQLGIRKPGRWCRNGCCDLDNPELNDCRQ